MTQFALKRFLIVLLLALAIVSFGCGKKVAPAPAPPPPPPPPPPAPTVTLSANPTTITAGQSVTLNYTSTGATAVTIDPGIGTVQPAGSGTRQVSPTATTTYRATASGPGGAAQPVSVVVTVNLPPPPPSGPAAKPDVTVAPPPSRTIDDIFKDTMKDVYFDYDKYAIRTGEERNLLAIASWLKQNPTVRFRIEGNADERGSQEYNIALGDERASAVMKYLSTQGIAENRMTTVSYGEERPVCKEQTENCWQQNRRAAFVRVP